MNNLDSPAIYTLKRRLSSTGIKIEDDNEYDDKRRQYGYYFNRYYY